jgi:pimeloyl-ACP methyl ester carboxylesterase
VTPLNWPCPLPEGGEGQELALACARNRDRRVLVLPALFDEASKLRRLTVEVMRRLDHAGVDSVLPDLPGCNESLQPLGAQTVAGWRAAAATAARHFGATHVLALRGGVLLAPDTLPGWLCSPVKGATILRQLLRARIIAAREAGVSETQEGLLERGRAEGLDLAGYRLGARFITEFASLEPEVGSRMMVTQDLLGGPGLWLRAEPSDDRGQADALAAIVAVGMAWEAAS